MRGFKIQKNSTTKWYRMHSVSLLYRACHSPEPEGSEMMLHHSAFMIAKRFWKVKQILCDLGKIKEAALYVTYVTAHHSLSLRGERMFDAAIFHLKTSPALSSSGKTIVLNRGTRLLLFWFGWDARSRSGMTVKRFGWDYRFATAPDNDSSCFFWILRLRLRMTIK